LVLPLIEGTVTGGSFGVESLAVPPAVLDAVALGAVAPEPIAPEELMPPPPVFGVGVADVAVVLAAVFDARAISVPSGGTSPAGVGRASFPAAQATEVDMRKGITAPAYRYLFNKVLVIGFVAMRLWAELSGKTNS
jgi:hypothetical protein